MEEHGKLQQVGYLIGEAGRGYKRGDEANFDLGPHPTWL